MISVIVPVYNVEAFLSQCLNSLLSQDFPDREILLIDDGSTDGCPQLCDECRDKNAGVRVFHTENRGLSAARNLGIDRARGEWLMFVDSDDWVEPGFLALPYAAAVENDADMVIFNWNYIATSDRFPKRQFHQSGPLSRIVAIEEGRPAAWNKLYRRALFDTVRYPEGRVSEDVATTYKLVYRADRIVGLDEALYNYRYREGSISRRRDEQIWRDVYRSHLEQYDDLLSYGHPQEYLDRTLFTRSLQYLKHMEPGDDPLYRRAAAVVDAWRGDPATLEATEQNALKLWRLSEQLFHAYYRQHGKKAKPLP